MSGAGVVTLTPEEAAQLPGPAVDLPSAPALPDQPDDLLPMPPASGAVIEIAPRRQGSSYEDYRAERTVAEAVERARVRQQRRRPAPEPEPEPERTPEQRAAERDAWVEARLAEIAPPATPDPTGQPAAEPEPRGPRQARREPEAQSAARTVLRNAAEGVTGIPRGALSAFASLFEAGDDLADWIAGTTPDTAPNTPGRMIGRGIRSLQPGREPETITGQVSEEVAQFVTGFLRGGVTLRRFGLLQGGGRVRQATRAAAAAAIADFFYQEADEANLAAVWQRAGLPETTLTDFLATRPDDEAAANRLRNAATGVVVGTALEGLMAVARATRGAMAARREAGQAAPQAARAEPATLAEASGLPARPERDLMIVGDPLRPLVEVRPAGDPARRVAESAAATSDAATGVPVDVTARGLANAAQPVETVANTPAIRAADDVGDVYVNWGRIQTGDDVRAVMRDMADAYRPRINEAGRGVQTNEATRQLADQMNLTVEQLLARRPGEVWNAEMALAARDLYTASGQRLVEAARLAAAPGAGALEAAAFRRMMSVHHAIQAEVLGARREAGRAVQAWAIPSRSGAQQMRMIEDLLEASGGVETAQAMARRLAVLADNLPPDEAARAMSGFVNRGWAGRSIEAVQQWWINALLSSPATHLANIIGSGLNIPLTMAERVAQAGVARAMGSEDAALMAEAPAMLYGLMTGFRDSLRMVARTYADDGAEIAAMIGRQDLPRQGAISSAAWGVDAGSGLGRALDFVGHEIVSAPGRAMGAEDAFFKSSIYRMELHAHALRQAMREVPRGTDGALNPEAVGARMAEIMRDPPESVRVAAADEALYRTFNRAAGPIARGLLALRNTDSPGWNLAMSTVLPFIRTPANLFSYGLERTPLAPMVGQWRADVAAGGARRDAALARVAVGSLILAHTFQMAEQGLVTGNGPSDPRERETWRQAGNQPYSVRIGDTWVPFNRLDPYGFMLGFAADASELMHRRDLGEREEVELSRLISGVTGFASNALADRTFFSGVAALAAALDPDRRSMEPYIDRTLGSLLVPGIVAAGVQAFDPTQYDRAQGWVTARLGALGNSEAIPRRNVWGEEQQRPGVALLGQAGAALSPIKPSTVSDRPIDREMQRLGMGLQAVDQNGTVTFGEAVVNLRNFNPAALDRLRVLAGNDLTLPAYANKGLADALDEMVQGRGPYGRAFLAASDEGRERAIRQVASAFRRAAREALLADPAFADVAELVARRSGESREGRGEVPVPTSPSAVMREPFAPPPPRRPPPRDGAGPVLR